MSEEKYEINDYKSAFDCFVKRFLVEKKSIFRLNSKDEIDCNDEKNKNDECQYGYSHHHLRPEGKRYS